MGRYLDLADSIGRRGNGGNEINERYEISPTRLLAEACRAPAADRQGAAPRQLPGVSRPSAADLAIQALDLHDHFEERTDLQTQRETSDPPGTLWGRVAILDPGGRTVEVDAPSGWTLRRLASLRRALPRPWVRRDCGPTASQATTGTGQPR